MSGDMVRGGQLKQTVDSRICGKSFHGRKLRDIADEGMMRNV